MSEKPEIPDPEALLRHGAAVRGLAAAILGDRDAADDIAQETYLVALRTRSAPRDPGAWLRGVARNLSRRRRRSEARRRRRETARPPPAAPASPAETAVRIEAESRLTEAVRALAEPYRTVVVLRYFDGLSTAETAARTGAPEATVKTRLRRALAMLRSALDERYGARAAWVPLLVRVARPAAPPVGTGAAATTALVAGGVVMAKKLLVAAVVLAVLGAVALVPSLTERSGRGSGPAPAPDTPPPVSAALLPATGTAGGPAGGGEATGERPARTFRVVVRYPDRSPAAGTRIGLDSGRDGPTREVKTGDDGAADLPAPGRSAVLHVRPPRAAPVEREVAGRPGDRVEIDLPPGEVISGVLLFGEKPAAGVEVHLDSAGPGEAWSMAAATDERGRFEFTGLPPGWRGWFFAGWGVRFVEPPGEGMRGGGLNLVAPARDLVLRAERSPQVVGSVVHPDGRPAAGARADLMYRDDEGAGGECQVPTDAEGRFTVALAAVDARLAVLSLTVREEGGAARETVELDPAHLRDGVLDAGRIVLRPARTFTFLVRNAKGAPVAGAVVLPEDDSSRASPPTDGDGRTILSVSAGAAEVRAGAPGEGVVAVALPATSAGPLPVTLPGGTLLTLRVKTAEGAAPSHLSVVLSADSRLFDGAERSGDPVYGRAGAARPRGCEWEGERTTCRYALPEDGLLRVAGIRPGVSVRLELADPVADRSIATRTLDLAPREHREVDLVVDLPAHTFTVRAADPDGEPIEGADVLVATPGVPLRGRTDATGTARITGVRGDAVRVTVTKWGLTPSVAGPFAVADLPEAITAVLRPGRTVELTVTDTSGAPAPCAEAWARAEGLDYRFQGYEEGKGVFGFRDLPDSPVRLIAEYAGRRFEAVVGRGDAAARISVPVAGSVLLRFDFELDGRYDQQIRLAPIPGTGGAEVVEGVSAPPGRVHHEVRIPAVLPGRYRVTLEHYAGHDREGADVYATGRTGPEIRVAAGEETEARIPR